MKLENRPLGELAEAFACKFGLTIYEGDQDYSSLTPCVKRVHSKKDYIYYALFKSSLVSTPYEVRLTKEIILHPAKHLRAFQLKQLKESAKK
jgi:hypothetical protein